MKKLTYIEPSHVVGNVYFIGSKEASCHLFDTEEGLILLDTGYEESLEGILNGISALGYDVKNVKKIIHSHGHYDHTDATAGLLKYAPDAKTYLNFRDLKYIKGFTPDYDIKDGDIIRLGSTEITCLHTPGHTEGTCSFFWNVTEGGTSFRCGTFGGAGTRQVAKSYLHENSVPYTTRGDFFRSIRRLMLEKVDVFIGNHANQNNTMGKLAAKKISSSNPFIGNDEWRKFLASTEAKLWDTVNADSRKGFVTYAHRGASHYCPENTFLSFYTGLYMGANGIETDVRRTKDGVLVLFHDDDLERVVGCEGKVSDMTFEELSRLTVKNGSLEDKIVTLDDFLCHFKDFPITLAIELKGEGVEQKTADAIYRWGVAGKTIVTSFSLDFLKTVKEYKPALRIGYLTKDVSDECIGKFLAIGGEQFCPMGDEVTPELVYKCHKLGLDVRAWGISLDNYKAVYDAGADGMTVNYPDLLLEYIKAKKSEE